MKVAILTFTDGTNIGQRLQNFALQHAIELSIGKKEVYSIKQGYPFNTVKRNIKKVTAFLKKPSDEMRRVKRQRKFDEFNEKNIKFYSEEMPFRGDNSEFAGKFNCFVVGSDQIWNPSSPFVGDNFFLTFARKEQRLTYAPSFSVDTLPADKLEQYKIYLEGFSTITVREDRGAELVRKVTGQAAEVVLDPTLLLTREEYDEIKICSRIKPKGTYILSMFLGNNPENAVEMVSNQFGIQVLCLDSGAVIGPDEFLDLVEHAELVLTDSYHITIFSILYHKPFVNFMRSGKGMSMSSRFETLYRLLGVRNRKWEYLQNHLDEIFSMRFAEIDLQLSRERERCRRILREELNRIPTKK